MSSLAINKVNSVFNATYLITHLSELHFKNTAFTLPAHVTIPSLFLFSPRFSKLRKNVKDMLKTFQESEKLF
jgi:hypothetical protein